MKVITDKHDARKAYLALKQQLTSLGSREVRTIGYPGGHEPDVPLYWIARHRMWAHLNDRVADNRFWICFGTNLQPASVSHTITVECNPPKEGINRRTAGVLLSDGEDLLFAHSGKIGGGKKGVGKVAFLEWYDGGGRRTIEWPDGVMSEMIVIGAIGSRELPSQLARFVHKVSAFKQGEASAPNEDNNGGVFFTPEFRGIIRRSPPSPKDAVYSHGIVVDALRNLLPGTTLAGNDKQRDLFCVGNSRRVTALFEVKTSTDTTAVYTGVGQLLVHSAATPATLRVLVLPGAAQGRVASALKTLGVHVLSYDLTDGKVTFADADEVLNELDS